MLHFSYDSTNHSRGTEKEEYNQTSEMYLSIPSTFLLVLSIPDLCGRQGAGHAGQGKVTCYCIVWSDMENDFFYTSKVLLFLSPAAHKCIKLVYLAASLGDFA